LGNDGVKGRFRGGYVSFLVYELKKITVLVPPFLFCLLPLLVLKERKGWKFRIESWKSGILFVGI